MKFYYKGEISNANRFFYFLSIVFGIVLSIYWTVNFRSLLMSLLGIFLLGYYIISKRYRYEYKIVFNDEKEQLHLTYKLFFTNIKKTIIIPYSKIKIRLTGYFGMGRVMLIKIYDGTRYFKNLKGKIRSDIFKENFMELKDIFEKKFNK